MIERIIENWLTNSNERVYQIPFCQVLLSEGYKVLHLSSHGVCEHGKDIISFDKNGTPCAFQLKTGDITSSVWRQIQGEIVELIELPIMHPSIKEEEKRRVVFVTNGKLTEDVRLKIVTMNRENKRRKFPQLEIIAKDELLKKFVGAQGSFLPKSPDDIQDFLKFYLDDGTANIDKKRFSNFIEGLLFDQTAKLSNSRKLIPSTILMVKYALFQYEKSKNYIAQIEAWVLLCCYLLAFTTKNKTDEKNLLESLDLCLKEIYIAGQNFTQEALSKSHFIEGSPMGDGANMYKIRTTQILGWVSALELIRKDFEPEYIISQEVLTLIKKHYPDGIVIWGESAIPYFTAIASFMMAVGEEEISYDIIFQCLQDVIGTNQRDNDEGMADPYYSADDILNNVYDVPGIDKIDFTSFSGRSFTMKSLIDILVRGQKRELLEKIWYQISYMVYCEFYSEDSSDYYIWKNRVAGSQRDLTFDSPQKWSLLEIDANKAGDIPTYLSENPSFILLFLLVYPHRFKPSIVKGLKYFQ